MGLGTFNPDESGSSTNNNSNSGSSKSGGKSRSSSSSGDYPQFDYKCPRYLVRRDGYGGLEFVTYPETPEVEYIKETKNSSWEKNDALVGWKRYWFSESEFRGHCQIVEKVTGDNLKKMLLEDPEKGLKTLRYAARNYDRDENKWEKNERDCAVCDKSLNLLSGDYRSVGDHIVCKRHNVEDLHNAGLLE